MLRRVPAGLVAGVATYALGRLLSPHVTMMAYVSPAALIAISVGVALLVVIVGIGAFFEIFSRT